MHELRVKEKDLTMEVLTLAVMIRLKITNQNPTAIEDTLLEDSPHLSELDRKIKITIKDIKEIEVLPWILEHETRELLCQIEDGTKI